MSSPSSKRGSMLMYGSNKCSTTVLKHGAFLLEQHDKSREVLQETARWLSECGESLEPSLNV